MIYMVTGGTRSGKSTYVENLLENEQDILYIATSMVTDDEMKERVRRHKERRGERYTTYEGHGDLYEVVAEAHQEVVMLECIGTMVTNLIFDLCKDADKASTEELHQVEAGIMDQVDRLIEVSRDKKLYVITNEVGMGLVSAYKLGRVFQDILGRVNQKLAKEAEHVVLMVSGVPLKVK